MKFFRSIVKRLEYKKEQINAFLAYQETPDSAIAIRPKLKLRRLPAANEQFSHIFEILQM